MHRMVGIALSFSAGFGIASAAPPKDPCSLLTTSEVASVFPGTKAGVRDSSREKYGISGCLWKTSHGHFGLETYTGDRNDVDNEIRGIAEGFVDPLKPGAKNNLRIEKLDGASEQARAIVEIEDLKRGILHDVAMLVTQRGDTVVVMGADELARMDRTKALASLQKLGASAAKRL